MPALLLLLPQLIALIPTVTTGIGSLIAFIAAIRTAAQQSGEWTPSLEQSFVNAVIAKASTGEWQTDAQIAAGK